MTRLDMIPAYVRDLYASCTPCAAPATDRVQP